MRDVGTEYVNAKVEEYVQPLKNYSEIELFWAIESLWTCYSIFIENFEDYLADLKVKEKDYMLVLIIEEIFNRTISLIRDRFEVKITNSDYGCELLADSKFQEWYTNWENYINTHFTENQRAEINRKLRDGEDIGKYYKSLSSEKIKIKKRKNNKNIQ